MSKDYRVIKDISSSPNSTNYIIRCSDGDYSFSVREYLADGRQALIGNGVNITVSNGRIDNCLNTIGIESEIFYALKDLFNIDLRDRIIQKQIEDINNDFSELETLKDSNVISDLKKLIAGEEIDNKNNNVYLSNVQFYYKNYKEELFQSLIKEKAGELINE